MAKKKVNRDKTLVQSYKKVKKNKKPQRSMVIGRAIEDKLSQLREFNQVAGSWLPF
jgi:hypothetical protein